MITEDQVVAMFAKANPVPSLDLLDPVEPLDPGHLEDRFERSRGMTELKTEKEQVSPRRAPWLVPALVTLAIVTAIVLFMASRGPQIATTPVDQATAFWVAVVDGDRDTAVSHLDPAVVESREASPWGRAFTLESQFAWYDVVGWQWTLDDCIETSEGAVECSVSARNAWTDALGEGPVMGTYVMEIGEEGITAMTDKFDGFGQQWSEVSFEPFAIWVEANHPADAMIMFDFEADVNPEILDLYEINTERFVQAKTEG